MDLLGRILMVEDDPRDVELTLTALGDYNLSNEVVVVHDGEELQRAPERQSCCPAA
jgi:CheY-like chemotaxis protein